MPRRSNCNQRCCPRVTIERLCPCPTPVAPCAQFGGCATATPFACDATFPTGSALLALCQLGNLIQAETLALGNQDCACRAALCRVGAAAGQAFIQQAVAAGLPAPTIALFVNRINQNLCCSGCTQVISAPLTPPGPFPPPGPTPDPPTV